MTEIEVTFHNHIEIEVQAQIFKGRTLISTCVAGPGATSTLLVPDAAYDIYLKNAVTGWEISHKLNCEAASITLMKHKGRYTVVTGSTPPPSV